MTDIVNIPEGILSSDFPTNADRTAGVFNQKSYDWASSARAMSARDREIAVAARTNALVANERAVTAASEADRATTQANASASSATASATSASNSANSATASANSATQSANSATAAQNSATAAAASALLAASEADRAEAAADSVAGGPVASINGKTGVVTLTAADIGPAATQAEAEAGTETALRMWSPNRVAQAISALSGSKILRSARTSNVQLTKDDNSKLIDITSGTFTQTFDAAATLGNGWFCYIRNSGTGVITLDPNGSETIDAVTSGIVTPGMTLLITCTESAFYAARVGPMIAMEVLTSGTSWTCPLGVTTVKITGVGGGGGGGRSSSSTFGQPGQAAGTFIKVASVLPGTSYSYAIGAAGSIGASGSNGTAGGNTTFVNGATTYTASGGSGGSASSFGATAGASATNGDVNIAGGSGITLSTTGCISGATLFGTVAAANSTAPAAGGGYGSGGVGANSSVVSSTASAGRPGVLILEY